MKKAIGKQTSFFNLRDHFFAFVIALVLVGGGAFLFLYNWGNLLADITSFWSDKNELQDLPVVYQIQNWALEVRTTKRFLDVDSISFYVMFDINNVLLQLEKANSLFESTYASNADNMIYVTLFPKGTIPADTTIYTLPLNGGTDWVTISDATIVWLQWWIENLSIQKK